MNGRVAKTSLAMLAAAIPALVLGSPLADETAPVAPRDYTSVCAPCHAGTGFAVRVLTDRAGAQRALIHEGTPLTAPVIRAIVRGGMGAMPAMSKLEVSDAELDGIIAELTAAGRP